MNTKEDSGFRTFQIEGNLVRQLAKAENASQGPAFHYHSGSSDPLSLEKLQKLGGTDPGFVNVTDYDGAIRSLSFMKWGMQANFDCTCLCMAVAVKHGDPSNAAMAEGPEKALRKMIDSDHDSIMGGTVACDFGIDGKLAEILRRYRIEKGNLPRILHAVIAPQFDEDAIRILSRKDEKCRMLQNPAMRQATMDVGVMFQSVRGGFLVQQNYNTILQLDHKELQMIGTITKLDQMNLVLAWAIAASSRSNTTTAVKDWALVANACGQQSRVRSAKLLKIIADDTHHNLEDSAIWTDSFMPEPDGADVLIGYRPVVVGASRGAKKDEVVMDRFRQSRTAFVTLPDDLIRGFCKHR